MPDGQEIDSLERDLEIYVRFSRILNAVNLPHAEMALGFLALLDRRPMPESVAAQSLGLPRTTIRPHVQEAMALGLMKRVKGGLILTEEGVQAVGDFAREAMAVASGEQKGFSHEMASRIVEIQKNSLNPKKKNTLYEELVSLSFSSVENRQ